jgi:DNA-binding CsgD family transcriptional regulator
MRCSRGWTRYYRGEMLPALEDLEHVIGRDPLEWHSLTGLAGAPLAMVRLEIDDLDGAKEALALAETGAQPGLGWVRGHVLLAGGDAQGALDSLLAEGALLEDVLGLANPAVVPWRSGAALAALALGDPARARELVEPELERARELGVPRAFGRALRVAALTAEGDERLAMLEQSTEVLGRSLAALEQARTLGELGAELRRRGSAELARSVLARALELADRCGSTVVAERAATELRAAGGRPRRRALHGVGSLTPRERRVAELAAEGLTTPAIAQALFVAPKTVEAHLNRVFRKLGVSGRGELASKLAQDEA